MSTTKSIALRVNPTAAQAARYRAEVRRYVEALAAGRLDETLVPEIEAAFDELGRAVNLDFEEVRREFKRPAQQAKPTQPTQREKPTRREKRATLLEARLASLPNVFGWKEVLQIWGGSRRAATYRLARLLEQDHITKISHGHYGVKGRKPVKQADKPEKAKGRKPEKAIVRKPEKAKVRKPETLGKEILGLPFARDISKISVRKAVDYAVEQFAKVGIDLLKEIPHFERNVEALKRKMTFALDIARNEMPVIEPEDIRQFVKDIQGGFVDIFAPWADLKELRAVSHFEKFPEMLGGDKGKRWTSLGQRDGDPFDDQVQARIEMIPVRELKPLQSEIFFDKLVGSLLKFGIPKPGGFLATSAIIIVSEEGFILDGHHRYGQALLTDPDFQLRAVRVPLDIETLLKVGRSYGAAIGHRPKGATEPSTTETTDSAQPEISAAQSLLIETYNEKSFVVRGDTKPFKEAQR